MCTPGVCLTDDSRDWNLLHKLFLTLNEEMLKRYDAGSWLAVPAERSYGSDDLFCYLAWPRLARPRLAMMVRAAVVNDLNTELDDLFIQLEKHPHDTRFHCISPGHLVREALDISQEADPHTKLNRLTLRKIKHAGH